MAVHYWFPDETFSTGMCDDDPAVTMTFETGSCVTENSRVTELWANAILNGVDGPRDMRPMTGRGSFAVRVFQRDGYDGDYLTALYFPTDDCNGANLTAESNSPNWGGRDFEADFECFAQPNTQCNWAEQMMSPQSTIITEGQGAFSRLEDDGRLTGLTCAQPNEAFLAFRFVLLEPTTTTTADSTTADSDSAIKLAPFLGWFLGLAPALLIVVRR